MPDTPHKILLPREEAAENIQKIFAPQIALLEQLVNYGSQLIPRAFDTSGKKLHDVVIVHNFLKQAVTLLDGMHLTASQGSMVNANILLRGLFEIRIYLEWIFQKDTPERGAMYFAWSLRRKRLWLLRSLPGTKEFQAFQPQLAHDQITVQMPALPPEVLKAEIAKLDRALAQPEVAAINAKFDAIASKSGRDREWYSAADVSDLAAMAQKIGKLAEYSINYGALSNLTHSLAFDFHVLLKTSEIDGNALLESNPIRGVVGLDGFLRLAFTFAMEIYRLVLAHYRPEELIAYRSKYLQEWQQPFKTIPRIEEVDGQIRITRTV